MTAWLFCIIGAYLFGSVPFGVLIAKARGVDIRQHGSKNIGATNVLRVLGRKLGLLCFFLDVFKGAGSVLAAGFICDVINRQPGAGPENLSPGAMWLWLAVAAAAVAGHMASIFLRFAGGKGVATGFGAALAMWPLLTFPALGAMAVWYAVLRATHYVSVASMSAAVSLPLWFIIISARTGDEMLEKFTQAYPPLIVTSALALLIIWGHRTNIARLRRGEESKTGGKAGRGAVADEGGES